MDFIGKTLSGYTKLKFKFFRAFLSPKTEVPSKSVPDNSLNLCKGISVL